MENLLLAALPHEERKRLSSFLEEVTLENAVVLIEPDTPIQYVYFPHDCITSTVQEFSDGRTVEAGLMGAEGFIGVQLWLRRATTPSKTLVQVPGRAARMKAKTFTKEIINKPTPFNELLAAYVHMFLVMTSQTAACNRIHEVDERLCRWLAMIHNRVNRKEFSLRQDFIGQMLGVNRPSVSVAASMLRKAGLIDYQRGHMKILDADGLRAGACECYSIMEKEVEKIFDVPWPSDGKPRSQAPAVPKTLANWS